MTSLRYTVWLAFGLLLSACNGSGNDVDVQTQDAPAQEVLDKSGKINQIMALNCKCKGDRISVIRQELAATAATLETAIAANQRALTAAKLATDQLVQSIAAAVVEEQRIQDQYHADGRNGLGPAPGSPVSVSINEVL